MRAHLRLEMLAILEDNDSQPNNAPCPQGTHWNADTERCAPLPPGMQFSIKRSRDATDRAASVKKDKGVDQARLNAVARLKHQQATDKLKMQGFFKLAKHHQKAADKAADAAADKDQDDAIGDPRPTRSFHRQDDGRTSRGGKVPGAYGYRPTWRD